MDIILQKLIEMWLYDMAVFSNVWMYIPLCIPALLYLCFFFLKWTVVTAPVWLPISFIVGSFRKQIVIRQKDNKRVATDATRTA